jgi:hypothetical protein
LHASERSLKITLEPLAAAGEPQHGQSGDYIMGVEVSGVLGLLVLILDIWAIVNIMGAATSVGSKVIWVLLILLLPLLGVLIWFFFGPRSATG